MVETGRLQQDRRWARVLGALWLSVALWLVPRSVGAQLSWEDRRRATPVDAVVGLSLIGGAVAVQTWWKQPLAYRRSEIALDEAVRDQLRTDAIDAATISDVGRAVLLAYPLIDVGLVWAVRDSPDVARQMFWLNLQGFGATLLANSVVKRVVGRQRPGARDCAAAARDGECGARNRWFSFPSGHAAAAFAGAGLTCVHHLNLPLYGSRSADVGACLAATATATVTAAMRLVADRHHLADVVMGAAIGGFFGFLVPSALAYRHPRTGDRTGEATSALATPAMARFSGAF